MSSGDIFENTNIILDFSMMERELNRFKERPYQTQIIIPSILKRFGWGIFIIGIPDQDTHGLTNQDTAIEHYREHLWALYMCFYDTSPYR